MDTIDLAQARQLEDMQLRLAEREHARREPGSAVCLQDDCGEPISTARQAMGATRCIDCQQDHEQRARQWAPRGHG